MYTFSTYMYVCFSVRRSSVFPTLCICMYVCCVIVCHVMCILFAYPDRLDFITREKPEPRSISVPVWLYRCINTQIQSHSHTCMFIDIKVYSNTWVLFYVHTDCTKDGKRARWVCKSLREEESRLRMWAHVERKGTGCFCNGSPQDQSSKTWPDPLVHHMSAKIYKAADSSARAIYTDGIRMHVYVFVHVWLLGAWTTLHVCTARMRVAVVWLGRLLGSSNQECIEASQFTLCSQNANVASGAVWITPAYVSQSSWVARPCSSVCVCA